MENIKMVPPWVEYYRKLEILFKQDPAVTTVFDDDNKEISLYVTGSVKADAITQLLPTEVEFGNISVKIKVIPADDKDKQPIDLIRDAFSGNKALEDIFTVHVASNDFNYVIFQKSVVQYWDDNLGDAHGVRSTLYQELAKEVIGEYDGVFYCTDTEYAEVGKPLGEWP